MKTCPYCAERIQDEAIKCKHCNEMLIEENHLVKSLGNFFDGIFSVIWKTCLVLFVLLFIMYSCVESMLS